MEIKFAGFLQKKKNPYCSCYISTNSLVPIGFCTLKPHLPNVHSFVVFHVHVSRPALLLKYVKLFSIYLYDNSFYGEPINWKTDNVIAIANINMDFKLFLFHSLTLENSHNFPIVFYSNQLIFNKTYEIYIYTYIYMIYKYIIYIYVY